VESFSPNLSPIDFVLRLPVVLDRGTKGPIPVDHTLTIKLVRAYENKISIQFEFSIQKQRTFIEGLKPFL